MTESCEKRSPRSFIKPMLACPAQEPFDRAGWLFEVKWDGFRAIAEIEHGEVCLYSRNRLSYETKFAPVVASLRTLGRNMVLDGELVVVDRQGRAQFQLLQGYQKSPRGCLIYYVFDLLSLDGVNLESRPLRERKRILHEVLPSLPHVRISEHIEEQGIAFYAAAVEQKLEGIIGKKASSPYRQGQRSHDWLKLKTRGRTEAVIGGYTEPRGSRAEFGALVLGVFEGDRFVYVGHTGSGFDGRALKEVRGRLEPLARPKCPFLKRPRTNAPAHWVEPRLVCEVAFQEWTDDGHLRLPIYLGLRDDKDASEVCREPLPGQKS